MCQDTCSCSAGYESPWGMRAHTRGAAIRYTSNHGDFEDFLDVTGTEWEVARCSVRNGTGWTDSDCPGLSQTPAAGTCSLGWTCGTRYTAPVVSWHSRGAYDMCLERRRWLVNRLKRVYSFVSGCERCSQFRNSPRNNSPQ